MLTVADIKELMEEPGMSTDEAERIRDACHELVRLARGSLSIKKNTNEYGNEEQE